MNKLLKTSFIYLVLGLIGGAFYREFTRGFGFSGKTSLSVVHTHLFILGFFMFIILMLFANIKDYTSTKLFKKFYLVYNSSVGLFILTLLARGVVEVLGTDLSLMYDKMISGIAGLSHILLTISFIMLYKLLKNNFIKQN